MADETTETAIRAALGVTTEVTRGVEMSVLLGNYTVGASHAELVLKMEPFRVLRDALKAWYDAHPDSAAWD